MLPTASSIVSKVPLKVLIVKPRRNFIDGEEPNATHFQRILAIEIVSPIQFTSLRKQVTRFAP